jgi:hypothetical protein
MQASLTAVPVLQAQFWMQDQDMISCEKNHGDARSIVVDVRHVMSSIDGSRETKEPVRQLKLKPSFGCRYLGWRFKRAPVLLMSQEMAC